MPFVDFTPKLGFDDVMVRPKRSTLRSRSEVDLRRTFTFRNSKATWTGVPVMAANMDGVGTFSMARAFKDHEMLVAAHKHYGVEEWEAFAAASPDCLPYLALSAGTSEADYAKMQQVMDKVPALSFICLDVANGYSEHFVDHVRRVRETFPSKTLIAGNVVTGEMVEELILTGADVIKVGIGPGSVCTTRRQTGVGYPQLSAVLECSDAAHGLGGHTMSDGGCRYPGDVSKAFAAGGDFVMMGGMFAAHDESEGEVVEVGGKSFLSFYGMSSSTAMKKHSGGVAEYRSSEGKHVLLPHKGPVAATVLDILGGVRSTCTYVGASTLKQLPRRTTFIRVSEQVNVVFGAKDETKEVSKVVAGARAADGPAEGGPKAKKARPEG